MPETALTYLQRGQSGIFAEVYFPRRIATQGTIFDSLQEGYNESEVKDYLQKNTDMLLQELRATNMFLTLNGMMCLRKESGNRPEKTQKRGLLATHLRSSVGQTMWWTEFGLMMMENRLKKQLKSFA